MKKTIVLLLLAVLMMLAVSGLAGAPTEYEIPQIGTELNGFVVTNVSRWEIFATDIVELEHKKTGSVLFWIANDNIDRSYMMAFNTPIYDDTGIAHVFEHATLGGSTKYPGANTFFELGAKTSNTFLNAQTGQYITMYPMASTSEDQLFQYIDYYMNGLTDPLAISNPYAMMREAYRYELDDADGELTLQGVVYSEMLGALTQSRMSGYNLKKMLFPGSYVSFISGGDPQHIPELTMEKLRAFHDTYYHPSNATMYLTGDLYLPRFLELLDSEFLSHYDRREIVIEDTGYTPLEPGYYEEVFPYAVAEGTSTDKAAIIEYAMPFDIDENSLLDLRILDYVAYYMNDESSPFIRLLRERLPGAVSSVSSVWYPGYKAALQFIASGVDESDKDMFKSICDDALQALLKDGVDKTVLDAVLVRRQFEELMYLDDSSVYRTVAQTMASKWTTFGDREAWMIDADVGKNLEEYITVENLNKTAAKYWMDLDTAVIAVTVPVPGLKEEKDAAMRSQLDEMKAAMSKEEVDALVEQTANFHAFVEESNKIVMPETLNALTVQTLPEEVSFKTASETSVGGIRVIVSEVDSPLIEISIVTDASVIPFEDLYDFVEFTSIIGRLGTDLYTREELPAKKATVSAGMSIASPNFVEHNDTRKYEFVTVTSWFTLPNLLEDSLAMVEDILYHTDFSDYDYIRSDAAQTYAAYMNSLDSSGLSRATMIAGSACSDASKVMTHLRSAEFIAYLDKISKMTDAEMDVLTGKFEKFRELIFNRNNAVLGVMGNEESIIRATALGYNLISRFDSTEHESVDYAAMLENAPKRLALVTGGNVVYNVSATDIEAAGYNRDDGALAVIRALLSDKLLYPELRVKNSAYGGYSYISDNSFGFYSYRDPKVAETYAVYESAADFLKKLEITPSELDGYIISVYGELTQPIGPLSAALIGIDDRLSGVDSGEKTIQMIRDIKAFSPEDIQRYVGLIEKFETGENVCVTAGARSMIEEDREFFDAVDYSFIDVGGTDGADVLDPSPVP